MSKDNFYTPTDIDALRMENELLAFEVRFLKTQLAEVERLRSRLAEAEREAERLRSRLAEAEREAEQLRSRLAEAEQLRSRLAEAEQLRSRLAKAERAEQDLSLLLRRLANSPLGWFFRLKKGFRVLEQRYLDTDAEEHTD